MYAKKGLTLADVKAIAAAAEAEAQKNGWTVSIAIVDDGGNLLYLQRLDDAPVGSVAVSQEKAHTAFLFKRPTKAFQDGVAAGGAGLRVLTLRNANAVEGGLPLVVDGKIIGAIGVSGGTPDQDGSVAKVGADALAKTP